MCVLMSTLELLPCVVSIIVLPTSSSHIPEVQPTSCDLNTVTPTCVKPLSPASYQLRYFLLVQCNLCLPNTMEHQKAPKLETSLIVQWLRLCTSPAGVRKKDSTCWAARPKDKLQNLGNYIRNPSQDIVFLCLNTMNSQENQKKVPGSISRSKCGQHTTGILLA